MTRLFKKIIVSLFRRLTSFYLRKNRIEVIAITGSAGKTTTKIAISQFLKDEVTYVPEEAYNTEIGIPLSVFKQKTPNNVSNLLAWLKILLKMLEMLFRKPDYKRIVIEMGADQPGDIEYLTSFIKPHIAVVTTVAPVHTEKFKNVQEIALEKSKILNSLSENDIAVLNYDDELVRQMEKNVRGKVFWIGKDRKLDLCWNNEKLSADGLSIDLYWKGEKYQANLGIIAPQLLVSLLSAVAVCVYLGEDIETLIKRLEKFQSQAGRMNPVKGLEGSLIIDDSYNANPSSVIAALGVLASLKGRKIAVLGSMNELGSYEKEGHFLVGEKAGQVCDLLITVGVVAEKYIAAAADKYMDKEAIHSYQDPYSAGEFLKKELKKGDIILVKGSQNKVFVEEVVKIIMANPEKSHQLLVRQSAFWQKKKRACFK